MQRWDWDQDDEQERERRLQERRQRVQERLAAQRAAGVVGAAGGGTGTDAAVGRSSRGKHEAALSLDAVQQLRGTCDNVVLALRDEPERREEARRDQWEQQVKWLKEEIATEAEACKSHARAIDLEWEGVHNASTPQAAAEAMAAVRRHCEQVLQSKEDLLSGIRGVLRERDEAYMKLLQGQTEETDTLIALMAQEFDKFRRGQEQALEAVEAAYLQERSELISTQKHELDVLLEKRSGLEQSFLDQYLKACEAYEAQLEAMKAQEAQEYLSLKRRLEAEVASLEAHLDSMRSVYTLNADKLHYNVRVLSERERENKEALQQQKRKMMRQWEVLSKLKKRYAGMEKRFTEENLKLADEYQRITRAFNHLQSKYRHFKAADLARFSKIRAMKEEEMDALVGQLAEVDAAIRLHVLGLGVEGAGEERETEGQDREAGKGEEEGEEEGAGSCDAAQLGLVVVGRALTSSAEVGEAAAGDHLVDNESEVVVLSAEEAAARGGLIAAYTPGGVEDEEAHGQEGREAAADEEAGEEHEQAAVSSGTSGGGKSCSGDGDSIELAPLAWQELSESLEAGVLSLLLTGAVSNSSSGTQSARVDEAKVQQLLAQLPEAAPGRWQAACVARGLGAQQEPTWQALEALFLGSKAPAEEQGEQAQGAEQSGVTGEGPSASGSSPRGAGTGGAPAEGGAHLVVAEQVQRGLQRLVGTLQAGSGAALLSPTLPCGLPAGCSTAPERQGQQREQQGSAAAQEPISATYWRRRMESVLPQEALQVWASLEPQLLRQLKLLQSRSKAAEEVNTLKSENEALKARLKELLMSPANKEMQLPMRILLE